MYRNSEHYPDPTAGAAIKNVAYEERLANKSKEPYLKWVYIASPYKGDVEQNVMRAKRYARFVARQCFVPVCPHIYLTQFLDDTDPGERVAGMFLGLQMLKRCNQMFVFGSVISEGMQKEINFAKNHNIPIRYFNNECEEVS